VPLPQPYLTWYPDSGFKLLAIFANGRAYFAPLFAFYSFPEPKWLKPQSLYPQLIPDHIQIRNPDMRPLAAVFFSFSLRH
jgi:hypothetical protein